MIETARLRVVPCEERHFEAILAGPERLGPMLGATVFEDGFDFPGVASVETVRFFYERLKADPGLLGWWMYLFVLAEDGVLIGQGGYKGRADREGMVEIGYAISPAYRRRGLATEAAQGFIDHAFAHDHVSRIDAHTLAEPNASTKVLQRVGMKFVDTVEDPRVGEAWRWSLQRSDYRQG
jgi:[ribosomal protein S5]-alanine N-acetyltransferase